MNIELKKKGTLLTEGIDYISKEVSYAYQRYQEGFNEALDQERKYQGNKLLILLNELQNFENERYWRNIAIFIMKEILYDNGCVTRFDPEYYNPKWIKKIADSAEIFFDKNDMLPTQELLEAIAIDNREEDIGDFWEMKDYEEFNNILNEYHDPGWAEKESTETTL